MANTRCQRLLEGLGDQLGALLAPPIAHLGALWPLEDHSRTPRPMYNEY